MQQLTGACWAGDTEAGLIPSGATVHLVLPTSGWSSVGLNEADNDGASSDDDDDWAPPRQAASASSTHAGMLVEACTNCVYSSSLGEALVVAQRVQDLAQESGIEVEDLLRACTAVKRVACRKAAMHGRAVPRIQAFARAVVFRARWIKRASARLLQVHYACVGGCGCGRVCTCGRGGAEDRKSTRAGGVCELGGSSSTHTHIDSRCCRHAHGARGIVAFGETTCRR